MTWKTIDSAPKDGTSVLLYLPDYREGNRVRAGWYSDTEEFKYGKSVRKSQYWVVISGIIFGNNKPQPTHWMPLPAEPA